MIRAIRSLPVLLAAALLAGCAPAGGATQPDGSGRLTVVTTTQHLADAVTNVAGDGVELVALLGPGVDPHTYVATENDTRTFQNADIIFYNGLRLEAQMDRFLEQLGQRGQVTVVAVGDQLDAQSLLSWEPEANLPFDPHIWNDVQLWKQVVSVVRDTLVQADPARASAYQANAAAYLQQLDELHAYIQAQAARLAPERRVLVTAHDAFSYFGRAYGFELEAVQGISTQTEASAADIQQLVDIVIARQVPAIFIESSISPRTIEAVKEAVQARGHTVAIGGNLYSDAMGEPGTPAGTYIGMMRHNIDTVVAALGG